MTEARDPKQETPASKQSEASNTADHQTMRSQRRELGAALVLLAAAGVFSLIARRVTTRQSESLDQTVRDWAQGHRTSSLDIAAKPVTLLSVPLLVVGATAALVWRLQRDGRRQAAIAVAVTPLAAAAAGESFTTFLAQRNPPDKGDTPDGEVSEPSFPSGHTTGVTAEALAVAFILAQEELATPATLSLLAAWPLLVGITRVYRDRHWVSDVLGGWAAGTAVAAGAALLYGVIGAPDARTRSS
jgi:membrane-associated phospholipid phosphatase